ncbi:hypothetical protein [Streptomyces sp. NPDC058953]|uniref:hypothetical protein n=1 Tax=unclassified Streptomyces TaxID=2593676 RepID=UPI003687D9DC
MVSGTAPGASGSVAGVALALLVAVLLALCPETAAGSGGGGPEAGERTVATAPVDSPGCGNGTGGGERDAQPATPPRGAPAHEPPPVSYDPHCAVPQPTRAARTGGYVVAGRPPPLGPPSPEELSILRI